MHCIYRHFDKSGKLLYVGRSCNLGMRHAEHQINSRWFSLVTTIKIQRLESIKLAIEAEEKAIKKESPAFNLLHNKINIQKEIKKNTKGNDKKTHAKKIIEALGGYQAVATLLNAQHLEGKVLVMTRQHIFNWALTGKIPLWAQYAFPKIWKRAERLILK